MQELCSTTTEERENIISCVHNHITVGDHHSLLSHDTITAFTVIFFDMPAGRATKQLRVQLLYDIIYTSRITRQLLIRLMYEPRTNTYEWQAYMPLKHVNQNKCFRDRNNMIKELVVVLNGLGFLTPPRKMW